MSNSVIRILDENTANKIAAGEVVERPASVVKELVENALDAYSLNIEVTIADGGIGYIRVTDDGVGMNAEDAALAVLRHATSKIGSVEDLYSVHSLGFRGEALPSIASVARFSLTTRPHSEPLATYVEVTGGVIADVREAGGAVGTTVTVAELFYNTPARLKFLKSPSTESGHIHDIIGKLALSHPEVAFKLVNNERLVLATSGNGSLLDALISLYGTKVADAVLPVNHEDETFAVTGFVAKPTLIKSSRQWQTFIVNGRVVNSRMIAKALDNAYHSLLPKAGYPLAVLAITVPAGAIDVNVHPQKSEIKFSEDNKIFKAVYHAVSTALTLPGTSVAATPATVVWPGRPTGRPHGAPAAPPAVPVRLWREEPAPFIAARESLRQEEILADLQETAAAEEHSGGESQLIPLGQVEDCYIIAYGPDGLYIIDQHAAHERILYDRLSLSSGRVPAQQLLIPLVVDFDSRETAIITEHLDLFDELGFSLELIGPNTMRLTEMPADVSPADARDFLHDILLLVQDSRQPSAAELRHACLQTAACRAAVKAGERLNMRQLRALVSELSATASPFTCPHGRPTVIRFTAGELAKMFKRT